MKAALKKIVVDAYQKDLQETIEKERTHGLATLVDGNETFNKFIQIVYAIINKHPIEDHDFNELATSEEVLGLAREVVLIMSQFNTSFALSSCSLKH